VVRRRNGTVVVKLNAVAGPYGIKHGGQFAGAKKAVYFGEFCLKFSAVEFREAAHHEYFLDSAALFFGYGSQRFIDGLLFGIGNEAAGVDDDCVGISGALGEYNPGGFGLRHKPFGVDGVF